jgi:ribonuclease P protein component
MMLRRHRALDQASGPWLAALHRLDLASWGRVPPDHAAGSHAPVGRLHGPGLLLTCRGVPEHSGGRPPVQFGHGVEEAMREAHVPAQQSQASEEARVPSSHVDPWRSCRPAGSPAEGPRPAVGLNGSLVPGVRGRASFGRLRSEGRGARAGGLRVVMVPHAPSTVAAGSTRLAVATPRSIGSAVVRNRVRRRIKHQFAGVAPTLPAGDYLVIAAPEVVRSSSEELRSSLDRALSRLLSSS